LKHRLSIIVGSTRPGRVAPIFAEWMANFAGKHDRFEPVVTDLENFDLPVLDEPRHPRLGQYEHEHTKRWSREIDAADAFVFVLPEYNYFAPPAVVNAVDYLAREWQYKPAGFFSYGGLSAGLRSVQSLKLQLTTLKIMPVPEAVALPFYQNSLDESRTFNASEQVINSATAMLDELARWSEALKPLRGPAK
jgi:NAD(P)H-dependent FMN reductase